MSKNQVFYTVKSRGMTGLRIVEMLGNKKEVSGDIGLEIEVEGNTFQKISVPAPWGYHKDGSLRGHDNAEYVLKHPIKFEKVEEAVTILWDMFKEHGSKLDESNRTSLHVHMNVQQWHLDRLTCFLALFFTVEEILTRFCGDHRVGNLFCLNAKDAPGIVTACRRFIQLDGGVDFQDGLHYSGCNVGAIQKFGSIELRHMRGPTKPQLVLDWVRILQRLYELSGTYDDPRKVCFGFSSEGPLAFLKGILGPEYNTVTEGCGMSQDEIMSSLYEGIRIAQDLCFCRDWSKFKKVTIGKDPFGRQTKKVLESIEANEGEDPYLKKVPLQSASVKLKTSKPAPSPYDAPYHQYAVSDSLEASTASLSAAAKKLYKPTKAKTAQQIHDELTKIQSIFKPMP